MSIRRFFYFLLLAKSCFSVIYVENSSSTFINGLCGDYHSPCSSLSEGLKVSVLKADPNIVLKPSVYYNSTEIFNSIISISAEIPGTAVFDGSNSVSGLKFYNTTVILEGLVFTKYSASAVLAEGTSADSTATLSIKNCSFIDNSLYGEVVSQGAAVLVRNIDLVTIQDSRFHRNAILQSIPVGSTAQGAALAAINIQNVIIEDSQFENNTISVSDMNSQISEACGGSIFIDQVSNFQCSNATFSNNSVIMHRSTRNNGGAICANYIDKFNVSHSYFTCNYVMPIVQSDEASGGAIFGEFLEVFQISDSFFDGNMAAGNSISPPNMEGAKARGGALCLEYVKDLTLDNCQFIENKAKGGFSSPGIGGGVYVNSLFSNYSGSTFIRNSNFSNNVAMGGSFIDDEESGYGEGGALIIVCYDTSSAYQIQLEDSLFSGNMAEGGDSEFSQGGLARSGGVVIYGSPIMDLNIVRCDFNGNWLIGGNGSMIGVIDQTSALFVRNAKKIDVLFCTFTRNSMKGRSTVIFGGAAAFSAVGSLLVSDSYFKHNLINATSKITDVGGDLKTAYGGALYLEDVGNGTVQSTIFDENIIYAPTVVEEIIVISYFGYGGGLCINTHNSTSSNIKLDHLTFGTNAAGNGGGLAIINPSINLNATHLQFQNNIGILGGGIFFGNVSVFESAPILPQGYVNFIHIKFEDNSATSGGSIYQGLGDCSYMSFQNATFSKSSAKSFGGAISITSIACATTTWMQYSTFSGNTAGYGGAIMALLESPLAMDSNQEFCTQCEEDSDNESPFQTTFGYATYPSALVVTGCPASSLYYNNETFSLDVSLRDGYNNTVKGQLLSDGQFKITVLSLSNHQCYMGPDGSQTIKLSNVTDTAEFQNLYITGIDGCDLNITSNSIFGWNPITSCSISLNGCPSGMVLDTTNKPYYYCVDGTHWGDIIGLALLLVAIPSVIIAGIVFYYAIMAYRKRNHQDEGSALIEIGKSIQMSLAASLTRMMIPVISKSEIRISNRTIGSLGLRTAELCSSNVDKSFRPVCVKIVQISGIREEEVLKDIKAIDKARHPNIVDVLGFVLLSDDELGIVQEFLSKGPLEDTLKDKAINVPVELRLQIALDISKACIYLHRQGVSHNGLNPQNIWLADDWTAKIGGYGLCKLLSRSMKTNTMYGDIVYMAPEVITDGVYSKQVDQYSFGVILSELLTGVSPYMPEDDSGQGEITLNSLVANVVQGKRPSTRGLAEPVRSLINDCLHKNPERRPTFREIRYRLKRIHASEVYDHTDVIVEVY